MGSVPGASKQDSYKLGSQKRDMSTKLFVYGIRTDARREDIEDRFNQCGRVTDVYNTGKGFAFVTMEDQEGVDAAIKELHLSGFDGQDIKVEQARPKEDRRIGGDRSYGSRNYGRDQREDRGFDRRGGGGDRACYNCNKPGHIAKECKEDNRRDGGRSGSRPFTCYNCQKEGHMARDCNESDRRDRGGR